MVDWNNIKATVEVKSATKTEMVEKIEKICHVLMADGQPYTVAKIRGWIDAGLNEGKGPDDVRVKVNWITVHYTLDHKPGFKLVAKNTYKYEAPKKKVAEPKK
jgi:hypothetical protein